MRTSVSFALLLFVFLFLNIGMSRSLVAQEMRKEVPAERILEMIEKGEAVEIDNAIITGELDLDKIKLETKEVNGKKMRVVESAITITDSIIQEKANFLNTQFNKKVDFKEAQFNGIANFWGAQFNGEADFWRAQFNKKTYFKEAQFNGIADFSEAQFHGEADFWGAEFNGIAGFWYAQFNGIAGFWYAQFNGIADFSGAQFNGIAGFWYTQFDGIADFWFAQFNKKVDFSEAQFNDEISFTNANFQTMLIEWEQIEGKLRYDGLFYIRLIKNFKEIEQFEDADDAYYSYRVNKRKIKKKWHDYPTSLLEFIFLDLSCGYGVKPERTILYGLVLIFLFSCFYYQTGAIKERGKPGSKPKFTDALYFSINTFTTVGYGDWYPTAECLKIKGRKICSFRTLAMIEGFMGWFMMALFLVTLARAWIR